MRCRSSALAIALLASTSCVRAPTRLDVTELVARRGPVEARRDLEIRTVDDPKDIQAHLALAALAEQQQRPAEAIAHLEQVIVVGGPVGTRWHADDRARLARLLVLRGQERLARESPRALADLERARELGASVTDEDLVAARLALALAELAHADAPIRARGRARLASLHTAAIPEAAIRGAATASSPSDRGALGTFLWSRGARRAAYDELVAWRAAALPGSPADAELQSTYLAARAWWSPIWSGEVKPPPTADLVGPERCRFAPACLPRAVAGDPDAERALLAAAPVVRVYDADEAIAFIALAIRAGLARGDSFGALVDEHVDPVAVVPALLPPYARPLFSTLPARASIAATATTPDARLVAAAALALDGTGSPAEVRALAGDALADRLYVPDEDLPINGNSYTTALVAAVARAVPRTDDATQPIVDIIAAYRRDPAVADRLGRDLVAESPDAALGHAILGALFAALGDPARARSAWQAAYDASPEPRFAVELALAIARAGDADAALLAGTTAAAAAGDPAPVWLALAEALADVNKPVFALDAARSALDLADAEVAPRALALAEAESTVLGRTAQAAAFAAQRTRLAGGPRPPHPDGLIALSDPAAAVAAYRANPSATTIAHLWVASRWAWADADARALLLGALDRSDPRRATIAAELAHLAGGADRRAARRALAALRDAAR